LRSVSTTWVLQTVPSFLTASFPSMRDDPGDGSRAAFRFRRGCDGLAGDEGGLKQCEAMRQAGNTVAFVFLPATLCLGVPSPNESKVRGLGEGEMMGGGIMASGKEKRAEGKVAAEAGTMVRSEVGVGEVGLQMKVVLGLVFGDPRKAELKRIGDEEGDEDAGVLVMQVMGVMGASLNASVTGAIQTRLPLGNWSLTTQKRVLPSPNGRPRSRDCQVHSHTYIHPRPPSCEFGLGAEVTLTLAVV
jgi:hypothetical protein